MKIHFRTTRWKRPRIPFRTNLRRYIVYRSRLSTLAASNKPQIVRSTHQESTSQGAPTYPCFSKPFNIYSGVHSSSTRPLLVLSTPEKHYKSFGFTRRCDLNMKIHFKITWWKRLRIPSRTNLRRYISAVRGFSTLATNKKPQMIPSKIFRSTGVPIVKTN